MYLVMGTAEKYDITGYWVIVAENKNIANLKSNILNRGGVTYRNHEVKKFLFSHRASYIFCCPLIVFTVFKKATINEVKRFEETLSTKVLLHYGTGHQRTNP
jgi:hypothetical protein